MTMTLPFLRMILHFSHIGFTDGRTFMLVPPVAVIFPQQTQAPFERMLNYYSRIDTVFNKKFNGNINILKVLRKAPGDVPGSNASLSGVFPSKFENKYGTPPCTGTSLINK